MEDQLIHESLNNIIDNTINQEQESNINEVQPEEPIIQNDGKYKYQEVSAENRGWLEQKFNPFKISEQDRLRQICNKLKNHSVFTNDKILDLLEEVEEMLEIQARNSFNLCVCGGMEAIIQLIFVSQDNEVRRKCCTIFAEANQNNKEVQEICHKLGAMQIMYLIQDEENASMKESLMGALSAFLRSQNYEAKSNFLKNYQGLEFISRILQDQNTSVRMLKKVVFLFNDIVLTDEQTFGPHGQPNLVKEAIIADEQLLKSMESLLTNTEFSNFQFLDVREYIIAVFGCLVQFKPEVLDTYRTFFEEQKNKTQEFINQGDLEGDLKELLTREVQQIDNILNPKIQEQEKQEQVEPAETQAQETAESEDKSCSSDGEVRQQEPEQEYEQQEVEDPENELLGFFRKMTAPSQRASQQQEPKKFVKKIPQRQPQMKQQVPQQSFFLGDPYQDLRRSYQQPAPQMRRQARPQPTYYQQQRQHPYYNQYYQQPARNSYYSPYGNDFFSFF